ncbi:putative 22-domain light- and oxygen-sensing histidine kinase [Haloarcula marismortui ATCC 43049]|uniref:22-domain light-and oxygen-sensing histidine kinase n=1 Tax=Haloarcula marismortui (strain ATCC 43049 / DSM 3752 / JCM 8966 / VKM B-1809) TaxID=272569 RepID=Q5UWI7_HALMA|nr:PAS domain S-box protein [Haloarcula marismortui]AAV48366.1 putative 22-domain light- and oxygen-sensing histidine kinase [Haloarcula marismortui ATCC 43049]QCP89892.1 PAS domain S-box protein [Haloarcula marismortui ATCC 43049]
MNGSARGGLCPDPDDDEGLIVSDSDGMIVDVTEPLPRVTGYSKSELLGMETAALFWLRDGDNHSGHTRAPVSETEGRSHGLLECADGSRITVEQRSYTVRPEAETHVCTTVLFPGDGEAAASATSRDEPPMSTVDALSRLQRTAMDDDSVEDTVERLLALGCEYLGASAGAVARVDDDTYVVEHTTGETDVYEQGRAVPFEETIIDEHVTGGASERRAFTVAKGQRESPDSDVRGATMCVPVIVGDDNYGVVEFTGPATRERPFGQREREFVELLAQWLGNELGRRRRVEDLERYESIVEAVDDPMYALDTDGCFTFVNDAAKREFGYGEEIIGEHVSIGMEAADIERIQGQIKKLLGTDERSATAEFELQVEDGERRIVENRLALIGDDEFRGTAGVLRDVTARQERKRELEQYETVAQTASDVIITIDTDSVVQNVNPAVSAVFGYEPEELIGQPMTALIPERLRAGHAAGISRYLSTGERALDWEYIEIPGCRADGTEVPLGVSFSEYEFQGEQYFTGIIRDISERKESERELESFQRAIEEAADGVAILADGEYEYVDQTHVDMYGFDEKDQLLGESWRKLYDDEETARLEAEAFPALEADGHWQGMVTGTRPDESTFPAELSLTIIDDGRLVCTVRDETERKARERELALKNRAMDEATVGIQITDPTQADNPLVYVNDGFERMTGYTAEDALGRNPRFLQGADTDPEQVARLREAIDADEPVSVELKNYRKDGTPYWARLSITPVTGENGTVTNYVGIQQDVTERRERKRQADARVDFLERMYEVTTDPETGFEEKISGLLEAGCEHLDLSYGYLSRIDMDDDPTPGIHVISTVGSHERIQPGESGLLSESYCHRTIDHEGALALTDAAESELISDVAYETFGLDTYIGGNVVAGDELYGTLCFASNESRDALFGQFERSLVSLLGRWVGYEIEQRDAREKLRQQQERLELTLSGTNTGITEWNLETDALNSDDTFIDLVGQDVDTAEEYFECVIHPDDREHVRETLEANLAARAPTKIEYRVQTDDDDTRWLQSRAVPTYDDDGSQESVLAIVTDISTRKAKECERQRNERRFKSLFADPGMLVGLLDTDGTLLEINETALKYVEQTAAELAGQPFPETPWWSHSEALQQDLREWIRRAADGEYVEYSAIHPGPDGDRSHIEGVIRPVTDTDGTVTSLLISGRDVTERERQRSELRDRQRKLDLVLSNTDTTFAEFDFAAGSVQWDEAMGSSEFGSPETLDEFFETIHPDDRERIRSEIETAGDSGEPNSVEFRFVEPDGTVVWVVGQAVPVTDDEGNLTERVVGIATDITDLKQREQALEDSRQRYQTLLQAAPDPIFVADAETGEIVEANAAAEELRGQPRDDIIGRHQTELHPEEAGGLYEDVFEQAFDDASTITELPDGTQPELATPDGETVPIEISAAAVSLPDGPVLFGVFRDVSDREERKRELELKERAMDEANVGITISDPDREGNPLVYVNDGFVDQTGYSREEALGRNCRFLQRDDRDQSALDELRKAIASEEPSIVELRNYRKDGEQFWNRLSVTPIYDDVGTLANYIGIQQDVSDEKTREQRIRALHGTTRELLEADDKDEAVAKALDTLSEELDFQLAGVYLREGDELVHAGTVGATPDATPNRIERGRTPLWDAIESGESMMIEDYGSLWGDIERGDVSKGLYIPVGEQGVFVVGAADSTRLDESEQRLVEVLAGNFASVLDTLVRQDELFEERERFQLLTESIEEYAFLVVDDDGTIQTWNSGAETLFGYDADTAVGMSMGQLHRESDRESGVPDRLLQQARIGSESSHEGWRVRADGSEFYADVRYAKLETDDGESRGYAKIVRDMTDERRQRRRTERFVEESEDVVTVVDPDGTVTYASGSAKGVFGYEPDSLAGENIFDYLHPDGREHATETFFSCVENSESTTAECRLRAPDGGWFNVEGRCRNMLDDDAIDGILVYLRNVTEQRERARRFEGIFNQTYQFTGLLNPDGTVIEANDAALDFGGLDRDEIVGKHFADIPWWSHSDTERDNVRDALERAASGEFVRYETEVRGVDGLGTIDFSVKPVTDQDENVTLLVVEGRDITARQQRRQHLQVMQRVFRHNIRNDLTVLRGRTEALADESDPDKRAQMVATVEKTLDKWERMTTRMKQVREVLDSRQHHETATEVPVLVERAITETTAMYPDAAIETALDGVDSVTAPAVLSEAVTELLKNAVEVSAPESVELGCTRPNEDWLELTITDCGPGMPETEIDVIETGEETPLTHGQGLGLWMVRMVIKQVGGEVSADVTDNGTTVRLRIPL